MICDKKIPHPAHTVDDDFECEGRREVPPAVFLSPPQLWDEEECF